MKALEHHEHASVKDATAGAELTKQAKFVSIHASVKDATGSDDNEYETWFRFNPRVREGRDRN